MAANRISSPKTTMLGALLALSSLSGCLTEHAPPVWYKKSDHVATERSPEPPTLEAATLAAGTTATAHGATATGLPEGATELNEFPADMNPVPPAPFTEGIFPCSDCHEDMDADLTPRKLTDEHEDIHIKHGPRERWCFDCHNPDDRDKLRLVSGRLVDFSVSYRLCGQCHGPKLRDWRAGVHGKRTGQWNGARQYLLCVHCHNPHQPRFKAIKPEPRPLRPAEIR